LKEREEMITTHQRTRPDLSGDYYPGRCNQTRINGKVVLEDYYRGGAHIYEIPQGRGKRRARVCFEETPRGDGGMLWEEYDGRAEYERICRLL